MRIHFQGLIVHARVPDSSRMITDIAVLMADPAGSQDHVPLFAVRKADVANVFPPTNPTTADTYCFDLTNARVTTDIGAGAGTVPYLKHIPQLSQIVPTSTGAKEHADVTSRTPGGNFYSFVDLPDKGTLSVEDFFPCAVSWGGFKGCIGQTVLHYLAASVLQPTVTFTIAYTSGQTITVEVIRNADVWITNRCEGSGCAGAPSKCSGTPTTSHSDLYKNFFATAHAVAVPTKTKACDIDIAPADIVSCGQGQDLDVDCSNSRFP